MKLKEDKKFPETWILVKHAGIADINPPLPTIDLDENLVVSFIPMKAVEEKTGVLHLVETRKISEVRKRYTSFIDRDIVFAKITPCMENGKIAVAKELVNGIGFGSTEFHVSRLTKMTNERFIFYYLVQDSVRSAAQKRMTGSA
ncbi:MAG: type I restriction endonuclease subunit S, partial [bacterium]